jgi:hypothetical protein
MFSDTLIRPSNLRILANYFRNISLWLVEISAIICSVRFLPAVAATRVFLGLLLALFVNVGQSQQTKTAKTDDEIRQAIIAQSIASYRGNCPCPYNSDKAGHKCGGRSAYSRPGGASPVCYAKDVTQKMVDDYKREHAR